MLPCIPMQGPRLTRPGTPALHMGHIRRTAWQGIPFPCLPAVPMHSGAPCATSHPPRPARGVIGLHRHILEQVHPVRQSCTDISCDSHLTGNRTASRLTVALALGIQPSSRHASGVTSPASLRHRRRGGGAARRLRVGLKADPGTAARLEAGNCEEVFACLF